MSKLRDIHDMIQCFPLDATESPELTASRLLDILAAMLEEMERIDKAANFKEP